MKDVFLIIIYSTVIVIILIDNIKNKKNVRYKPKKYLWLVPLFLILIVDLIIKR